MLKWDGEAISGHEVIKHNNKSGTDVGGIVKCYIHLKPSIQPEKIFVAKDENISVFRRRKRLSL